MELALLLLRNQSHRGDGAHRLSAITAIANTLRSLQSGLENLEALTEDLPEVLLQHWHQLDVEMLRDINFCSMNFQVINTDIVNSRP